MFDVIIFKLFLQIQNKFYYLFELNSGLSIAMHFKSIKYSKCMYKLKSRFYSILKKKSKSKYTNIQCCVRAVIII